MRYVLALLSFVSGIVATYGLYRQSSTRGFESLSSVAPFAVAGAVAFVVSLASRSLVDGIIKHFIISVTLSYASYFVLLLVHATIVGAFAQVLMWILVIVLFAIPFMFPLTFGAWCAERLAHRKAA